MTVTPVGSEFQVNTYTTSPQFRSAVAVDGDGNFAIAWQSNGQDGDGNGVYAQRYNADGTSDGDEFQVNTYTTSSQFTPAVAVGGDGNFVITWESFFQEGGSNTGIYAQRYNADGTTDGDEFQVNTYTTNSQSSTSVGVDENGDFVITWESNGQDGDNTGIYAQRFSSVNSDPTVVNPIADQTADPLNSFSFTVPDNTFDDADGDPLTLSATLENGDPLPDWLSFDAVTSTFSGFPTGTDLGTISVSVTADDGSDNPAVDTFDLTVEFPNTPTTTNNINGDGTNNTLNGTSANDLIKGRGGNDILTGRGGDDLIQGGSGADEIRGSSGNDLLTGDGGDDLLFGDKNDDILIGGGGRDTLQGGKNDDILDGGGGIDELRGGAGNDQLFGGNGRDVLIGGAGSDEFFLIPDTGEDSINDFEDGIDTFVLPVGITSDDLDITANLSGDALISFNGQRLATVENAAGLIDGTDFINV